MRSLSRRTDFDRAQPLLGTLVSVGCRGLPETDAIRAIDAAFAAIRAIHFLMSFQEPASDVSRLNREASKRAVSVNPHTYSVLSLAQEIAKETDGVFDVSVGGQLARWGHLPAPDGPLPDPTASWRDIELLDGRVRFHRPLWIDLSGIAKGYAVDQATAAACQDDTARVIVNAGGDIRVQGNGFERILLDTGMYQDGDIPAVELENGSIASSTGRRDGQCPSTMLVDMRQKLAVGSSSFVSVAAQSCAIADALTKVVLALGQRTKRSLTLYGAKAFFHDVHGTWTTIGETT